MMRVRRNDREVILVPLCVGFLAFVFAAWLPARASVSAAEPDFFDPGGYYFPTTNVTLSGYKIEWIGLHTLEYYYEGALHYQTPRFTEPSARLMLTRLADKSLSTHDCSNPTITRDSLAVICSSTPMGVVSVRGTFVDKRGQFWNRNDIVAEKAIVAVATVTVSRAGNDQRSLRISFTYSGGH